MGINGTKISMLKELVGSASRFFSASREGKTEKVEGFSFDVGRTR